MTDWCAIFIKYMDVVGSNEGVHFLYKHEWTEEEWAAILEVYNEVQVPKGWAPFEAQEE